MYIPPSADYAFVCIEERVGEGLEGPDWTDASKWILPGFISLKNEVENIKSKLMVATLIYNFSNFTLSKLISFGSKE